ncbi:purine-binding chemotaxis protein CheW [Sphingomonas sp. SORGH_AS 950]|uniref:chemotaxis protein CheW n=1 Tax=unclassified Sphingomonas TaxID=196159 RepID=UPI00277F0CA7|nr:MULTISPECIES: chemotaxis protein CheW [unclassified Sphingomonas]MDQ1158206.1 purine-binding chemotaxis protein CheW [Sphingomonas sp. SORGH_AS_0950]MDR6113909.1 purine-binding chemotaxis protein CheW [Sphingomonas sp. SORGH_AS_0789]MDR6144923.1 purine-binding chemotaxis protein CheW [Sphingomonas sp. SORGH_AS_0870]MDR6148731.1 purine-binding chemotaxis protein CheW [Sphingomonas sp. SORGH_AS_0742]
MSAAGGDIQVVVFGLGDEEFALPVTAVREILDHRPAYRVPAAPEWFLGLTDVRGLSVPMVDLRSRLGLPPVEPTLTTRILVVDMTGAGGAPLALGLVVDRVLDVSTFAADSVEGSPDIGGRWRSQQIEAILRRGAGFVALLDPARLFGADDGPDALATLGLAA